MVILHKNIAGVVGAERSSRRRRALQIVIKGLVIRLLEDDFG